MNCRSRNGLRVPSVSGQYEHPPFTVTASASTAVREWKADEIWYVVGAPQQLHFRQVFAAAHRRGHTARMEHIAFGSILGPDGKMFKTRSGESIGLLEVIEENGGQVSYAATSRRREFTASLTREEAASPVSEFAVPPLSEVAYAMSDEWTV